MQKIMRRRRANATEDSNEYTDDSRQKKGNSNESDQNSRSSSINTENQERYKRSLIQDLKLVFKVANQKFHEFHEGFTVMMV